MKTTTEVSTDWSAFWDKIAEVKKMRDEIRSGIKDLYKQQPDVPQGFNEQRGEFQSPNNFKHQ